MSNHPQVNSSSPAALPTQQAAGGYPALAELINSSPSHTFQLFRRFGSLNARCLLYLQDELCELEETLQNFDNSQHDAGSRRYDQHPRRGDLIRHITTKIDEYSNSFQSVIAYTRVILPTQIRQAAVVGLPTSFTSPTQYIPIREFSTLV